MEDLDSDGTISIVSFPTTIRPSGNGSLYMGEKCGLNFQAPKLEEKMAGFKTEKKLFFWMKTHPHMILHVHWVHAHPGYQAELLIYAGEEFIEWSKVLSEEDMAYIEDTLNRGATLLERFILDDYRNRPRPKMRDLHIPN